MSSLFDDSEVEPALDLLELAELAWHDCYGEITPSESVIDDILVVSECSLSGLVAAVKLAVTDHRDLRVLADDKRGS